MIQRVAGRKYITTFQKICFMEYNNFQIHAPCQFIFHNYLLACSINIGMLKGLTEIFVHVFLIVCKLASPKFLGESFTEISCASGISLSLFLFSLSPSLFVSVCLSMSVCMSVSASLSLSVSVSLPTNIYVCMPLSLSLSLSLSLCLSLSFSLSLPLNANSKNAKTLAPVNNITIIKALTRLITIQISLPGTFSASEPE